MTPRCIIRITCLWITVAAILLVSQAYGQDVYVYSSSSVVGGQVVGTVEAVCDSSVADNYDMMLVGWLDDDQRQCKDTAGDSCSGCTYLYADLSATAVAGTAYTVTGYSELTTYYYYYPYGYYDPEYFFYFSPGDSYEEEWIRFTGPGPLVYLAGADISLGEAFTQVQCPHPTGETSEFKGWYDTGYEEGGKFEATLSVGGNYVGRQITEEFTGATDGCYAAYPNQVYDEFGPPPGTGQWTIQSGNKYDSYDYRLEPSAWLEYYRANISGESCTHTSTQRMLISPCVPAEDKGEPKPYGDPHTIGLTVYRAPTTPEYGAFRDGATGSNQQ